MNQSRIHLINTHLPVFGTLFVGIVLFQGLWTKSHSTKILAYTLFIISTLGACISYITNHGAKKSAENLSGILEGTARQHEAVAILTLL